MDFYTVTLVNYFDVWGNNGLDPETGEPDEDCNDEGFQVNDLCSEWTRIVPDTVIQDDPTTLRFLQDVGFLKKSVTAKMIDFEDSGAHSTEINASYDASVPVESRGRPLGRLDYERVDFDFELLKNRARRSDAGCETQLGEQCEVLDLLVDYFNQITREIPVNPETKTEYPVFYNASVNWE